MNDDDRRVIGFALICILVQNVCTVILLMEILGKLK